MGEACLLNFLPQYTHREKSKNTIHDTYSAPIPFPNTIVAEI
jgi:hypothetical protein